MRCVICNSKSEYYFSKTYIEYPFDEFMKEIGTVDYFKCIRCGFVLSKTHAEINEKKWNRLNQLFHQYNENSTKMKNINQPPYAEQAIMLSLLGRNKIINIDSMIDYAAGYGTLSFLLSKYYDLELSIFDPYVQAGNTDKYIDQSELKSFKTVINSAMFEHILNREDLERVNDIVDSDGCLIIHTVICENVPDDPDWFYLRPPVHTAFHTNKSMEILMNQWGYRSSIYCPKSKCWVLLKKGIEEIEKTLFEINRELQSNWFYYKNGFLDYWKGF